jgi:tetratricopeptide (TPR) repeat protein
MEIENYFDDEQVESQINHEEFCAMVRALSRKEGFGLFFVQASPWMGREILTELRNKLSRKKLIEVTLRPENENLFEQLESIWDLIEVDIFWIEGLEQLLLGYEDIKQMAGWDTKDLMTYSWKDVPPVLSHLNLGRERFEAKFKCALVFVVPLFTIKYLSQRATDFFDWKSGFFEFPDDQKSTVEYILEDAYYGMHRELSKTERLEEILQIRDLLNQPISDIRRRAELLRVMGQLLELNREYEQASISYHQATRLIPDFGEAWNNEGIVLRKLGRYDAAIKSHQNAIAINPHDSFAYRNLGNAYLYQNSYEEAIEAYQAAIEISPQNYFVHKNLGTAHKARKDYSEAIDAYQRAARLSPQYSETHQLLGNTYKRQKDYEAAILSCQKAIELDPKNTLAARELGSIYLQTGRLEEGIQYFNQAIQIYKKNSLTYYLRALTYLKLNQPESAETDLKRAIAIAISQHERAPIAWCYTLNLALYHLAANQQEESDRLYTSALTLSQQ